MTATLSCRDQLLTDGFAIIRGILSSHEIPQLIGSLRRLGEDDSVRRRGGVFAVRNLLDVSPAVRELAHSPRVLEMVYSILGNAAFPVRGILFDKTSGANWKVPWHQDVTIAVADRQEVEGFGPWSMKAGVLHVQPPASVLEKMLSVRIHLDPCSEANGALKVVPGSHQLGRLPEQEAGRLGTAGPATNCAAEAGDALLMRPLLLHASSAAAAPTHRRVIHLDFAAVQLPGGLRWASEEVES